MRNIKFVVLIGMLLCLAMLNVGCTRVESGHVGVKVNLLGGDKGVDLQEVGVGRHWVGWNEELHVFPVFQQNVVWTQSVTEGSPTDESITFQTKEGMSVNTDVGLNFSVEPTKVSLLFQKYRKGVDEIKSVHVRNAVRDAFIRVSGTMPIESVYGGGKAELLAKVEERVKEEMAPMGINIEHIYLVGDMRLPQAVVDSLNAKIAATQKAQMRENELREAEAQAKKEVAKADGEAQSKLKMAEADAKSTLLKAEAEAKANKMVVESITPALATYITAKAWDGKMPMVSGGATPLVNMGDMLHQK